MLMSLRFHPRRLFPRRLESSGRVRTELTELLFPCVSDQWLTCLRIGLAVQVVLYCWLQRMDWEHLFTESNQGWIRRDLLESVLSAEAPFIPRLGWLTKIGSSFGASESITLSLIWGVL